MSVGHSEHRSAIAPSGASSSGRSTLPGGGRVSQIDALRVLSCLSVIAVHAIGGPYPIEDVGLNLANFLLHYSREVFFFVSALVLVRTYYPRLGENGRLSNPGSFRWRRLKLIGMPYLWWSTIYLLVGMFHTRNMQPIGETLDNLPVQWLVMLATGSAFYHMYFLLVTLQFALVFPLMLWLLHRTEGRHVWLVVVSGAVQLATLVFYHWVLLPGDGWRGLLGDASLPAYQFWLVLGAVAGLHLERWHRWLTAHARLVFASVPVAVGLVVWVYYAQVPAKGGLGASSPLQPMVMLWSAVMLGALYLISVRIMDGGSRPVRSIFSYVAQLSFGIYLIHPMVLDMVNAVLRRTGLMRPQPWVAVVAFVATTTITVLVCAALHRTRLSMQLMGRGRRAPAGTPRFRLSQARLRSAVVPLVFLAFSVLAVLLIGGDQSPPSEASAPTWEETVQASDPVTPDDGCDTEAIVVGVDCTLTPTQEASSTASASGG